MAPSFWVGSAWDRVSLHVGQGLGPCHPPRSPTSALGRGAAFPSGLYQLHPFMGLFSPSSSVSQSISSAPGLPRGLGFSNRLSLIAGHSHWGLHTWAQVTQKRSTQKISRWTSSETRCSPDSPSCCFFSWSRLPTWTPPGATSLASTLMGSSPLELLPTCTWRSRASPQLSQASACI